MTRAILLLALAAAQPSWEEKRIAHMKFPEILAALKVEQGSRVADVGSGDGVFTVPLARAVGTAGRIYAVDIEERVLKTLRERVAKAGLGNVEAVLAAPDNPKLAPGSLDAAMLIDAYH